MLRYILYRRIVGAISLEINFTVSFILSIILTNKSLQYTLRIFIVTPSMLDTHTLKSSQWRELRTMSSHATKFTMAECLFLFSPSVIVVAAVVTFPCEYFRDVGGCQNYRVETAMNQRHNEILL